MQITGFPYNIRKNQPFQPKFALILYKPYNIGIRILELLNNESLLNAAIRAHLKDNLGLTYWQKSAMISRDYLHSADKAEDIQPSIFTANLLRNFKETGLIRDWTYVPKDSTLDILKIDFTAVRCGGSVVGIQATSTIDHARKHRSSMRRAFRIGLNEQPFIVILNWRNELGQQLTVKEMTEPALALIQDAKSLAQI